MENLKVDRLVGKSAFLKVTSTAGSKVYAQEPLMEPRMEPRMAIYWADKMVYLMEYKEVALLVRSMV